VYEIVLALVAGLVDGVPVRMAIRSYPIHMTPARRCEPTVALMNDMDPDK
jgi:hypothetical protein